MLEQNSAVSFYSWEQNYKHSLDEKVKVRGNIACFSIEALKNKDVFHGQDFLKTLKILQAKCSTNRFP